MILVQKTKFQKVASVNRYNKQSNDISLDSNEKAEERMLSIDESGGTQSFSG